VARSLDVIVVFDNPPEKGKNNLCVSARRESPAGGEKGRNLFYGDLRLLESVGKRNEKGRWGGSVGFSEIDFRNFISMYLTLRKVPNSVLALPSRERHL
jgi:hypothetical protein